MTYQKACQLLGLTTPKTAKANAALASSQLKAMLPTTPLRYKAAAILIIREAR